MNTFVPPRSSRALVGDCCNTAELPLNRNPSSQWPGDPNDGGDNVDNDGDGDGDGGDNDGGDGGAPMMMNTNNKPIESSCSWSAEMCWSKRQIWGKKHFWKKQWKLKPINRVFLCLKAIAALLVVIGHSYWVSQKSILLAKFWIYCYRQWYWAVSGDMVTDIIGKYQIWSSVLLYLSIVHLFVHHWTCDAASTW